MSGNTSSVNDNLHARLLGMKSVRARYSEEEVFPAPDWNYTAVWCDDTLKKCVRLDGTPGGSTTKRDIDSGYPGIRPIHHR